MLVVNGETRGLLNYRLSRGLLCLERRLRTAVGIRLYHDNDKFDQLQHPDNYQSLAKRPHLSKGPQRIWTIGRTANRENKCNDEPRPTFKGHLNLPAPVRGDDEGG